jgi:prepilin-type processing-associated H-X9-DG protein
MQELKILRCPSAADFTPEANNPVGGGTILGLHVFNSKNSLAPTGGEDRGEGVIFTAGWKDEYGPAAAYRPLGRTNFMGVAGCGTGDHPFFRNFEGVYTNRSEKTLGQLSARDGASNTLLYGETCGTRWSSGPDTQDIAWMAGGGMGTYLGLQRGNDALLIAFSSWHSGGVNFCFGDGSVRKVRYGDTKWDGKAGTPFTVEWHLLQQLAGWRDGGAADVSELVD